MRLRDSGDVLYDIALATATHSFTPKQDRSALVTNIVLNTLSADDIIRVTVGGKTIMRLPFSSDNKRNLFLGNYNDTYAPDTIFKYVNDVLGRDMSIPVPQGDTITVYSEAGATFDLFLEYQEYSPGSFNQSSVNLWNGMRYLIPVAAHRVALAGAVGDNALDTSVAPDWVPDLFLNTPFRAGWSATIYALFLHAAGVNAYASTTDHRSITQYLMIEKNGTQLLGRGSNGIPLVGAASATGSANVVNTEVFSQFPRYSAMFNGADNVLDTPWTLANGDTFEVALHVTGDVGAGANYASAYVFALVELNKING